MKKNFIISAIVAFSFLYISCGTSDKKRIEGVWVPIAYSYNGEKWIDNPEKVAREFADTLVFTKKGLTISLDHGRADTNHYEFNDGILMVGPQPVMVQKGENSKEIILAFQDHVNKGRWGHPNYQPVEYFVKLKKVASNYSTPQKPDFSKVAGVYSFEEPVGGEDITISDDGKWKSLGSNEYCSFQYSGTVSKKKLLIIEKGFRTCYDEALEKDIRTEATVGEEYGKIVNNTIVLNDGYVLEKQ